MSRSFFSSPSQEHPDIQLKEYSDSDSSSEDLNFVLIPTPRKPTLSPTMVNSDSAVYLQETSDLPQLLQQDTTRKPSLGQQFLHRASQTFSRGETPNGFFSSPKQSPSQISPRRPV